MKKTKIKKVNSQTSKVSEININKQKPKIFLIPIFAAANKEKPAKVESTTKGDKAEEQSLSSDSEADSQEAKVEPLTRDDLLEKLKALLISSKKNDEDDEFGSDFDDLSDSDFDDD